MNIFHSNMYSIQKLKTISRHVSVIFSEQIWIRQTSVTSKSYQLYIGFDEKPSKKMYGPLKLDLHWPVMTALKIQAYTYKFAKYPVPIQKLLMLNK